MNFKRLAGCALIAAAIACSSVARSPDRPTDATRDSDTLRKVMAGPHEYFRWVNRSFAKQACARLVGAKLDQPIVALHGDAHLEQFAVTGLGYGLTDFDDVVRGPASMDLVRFGTSLLLAAHGRGDGRGRLLVETFLSGYWGGLDNTLVLLQAPQVVERARRKFNGDSGERFVKINRLLSRLSASENREVREAFEIYARTALRGHRELDPRYFEVVYVRRLHGGIGSSSVNRFMVRARGQTDNPADDEFIELKQIDSAQSAACLQTSKRSPDLIATVENALADPPDRFLGGCVIRGKQFWVHAWPRHYWELSIHDDSVTFDDWLEIAKFVGQQLSRGHLASRPSQSNRLLGLRSQQNTLIEMCLGLAKWTLEEWSSSRSSHAPSR